MGFGRNTEETPSRASLTEALLEHQVILEVGPLTLELAKSSSLDSIWNLTNVILGAGMFALPRVFGALGLVGGALIITLVGITTYCTIAIMLRSSEHTQQWTYASALHAVWGRRAAAAVHAAVIAGCIGFVALYLIITCDVFVGNKVFTGIISDVFPQLPDPLPWYLSRTALLTWIALVTVPLLSLKSLHGLAFISAVSVASSTASMLCLLALWAGAAARGMLAPLRLWPKLSFFGDSPLIITTHMIATMPVAMTAFVCQMSIHPIARDLHHYTPRKMRRTVASSLFVCALLYFATGASGFSIFGDEIAGDVLSNVQPEVVAVLLGCSDRLGLAFVALLKSFVALAMLTSIPINIWPLREEVLGLLTHAFHGQEPSRSAFYAITYGCLFGIWATAVAVESAYQMVGIVGATCGIALAFVFPGMLALRIQGVKGTYLGGLVLLGFGGVLMVAGVVSTGIGTDGG